MSLRELKNKGIKNVYLNGFLESINYVINLDNVIWTGETKSYDGYDLIQCYETKD